MIDSPENIEATKLMADGVENGAAPKAVTTYMEPRRPRLGDRQVRLHAQLALRLRRRPADDNIKGKVEVVPFPEWEGGGKAGILGGGNAVISSTPRTRAARCRSSTT